MIESLLDWARIAQWTDAILAEDLSAIATVFARHRAPGPRIVWNPAAEVAMPEPLPFLLHYWRGLADGGCPHFSLVDPFDMRPALGHVMLLDAVDGGRDFRYRLYGSIVARVSGFEMTGKLLSEHRASGYAVEFGFAGYRAALTRGLPLYSARTPVGAVRTSLWHRLALPLVDDNGARIRLLSATVAVNADGRTIHT